MRLKAQKTKTHILEKNAQFNTEVARGELINVLVNLSTERCIFHWVDDVTINLLFRIKVFNFNLNLLVPNPNSAKRT